MALIESIIENSYISYLCIWYIFHVFLEAVYNLSAYFDILTVYPHQLLSALDVSKCIYKWERVKFKSEPKKKDVPQSIFLSYVREK